MAPATCSPSVTARNRKGSQIGPFVEDPLLGVLSLQCFSFFTVWMTLYKPAVTYCPTCRLLYHAEKMGIGSVWTLSDGSSIILYRRILKPDGTGRITWPHLGHFIHHSWLTFNAEAFTFLFELLQVFPIVLRLLRDLIKVVDMSDNDYGKERIGNKNIIGLRSRKKIWEKTKYRQTSKVAFLFDTQPAVALTSLHENLAFFFFKSFFLSLVSRILTGNCVTQAVALFFPTCSPRECDWTQYMSAQHEAEFLMIHSSNVTNPLKVNITSWERCNKSTTNCSWII